MAKPLTNDIFITRAKSVYNDKYDYSKINYINSDTNIVITCPKHGDFEKRPLKFLNLKTERQGFEPWVPKEHNDFRDRPIQPLWHLSSKNELNQRLPHPDFK